MKNSSKLAGLLFAMGLGLGASTAHAVNCGVYASTVGVSQGGAYVNGALPADLTTDDLKLENIAADDCYGTGLVTGGNDLANVESFANTTKLWFDQGSPSAWAGVARTDSTGSSSEPLGGFTFAIEDVSAYSQAGSFNLVVTDNNGETTAPNLPLTLDLIITNKAGSQNTHFFFFDNLILDTVTTPGSYTMAIRVGGGRNNPGNIADLSGFSVLARNLVGTTIPDCQANPNAPGCGPNRVPEPGSLALVGIALASVFGLSRRRRIA